MLTRFRMRSMPVWLLIASLMLVLVNVAVPVFAATTVSVLDDQISVTAEFTTTIAGEHGSITVDGDTVTATATGFKSANKTTVTITNNTSTAATISFSFTMSNYSANSENKESGSKTLDLDAWASTTLSITCKNAWSIQTATMTLSNFSYTAAADKSKVIFDYTGGSITVGGVAVSNGGSADISSEDGAQLVATPNSGYTFLGWVNGNTNVLLSTNTSYTLYPVADMTVKAAFASASTKAWFKVGDYLVDDLNLAVTLGTLVIPMYDGTLFTGDYTIPSGVTLLIPRDDSHSVDKTTPATTAPTNYGTTPPAPTSFRKLTMADGANITVNGAISISGTQWSGGRYVSTTGAVGFIHMNSGSSITINSGGFLYAWGYVTGSGSVTAKSGATVYEHFQVAGWRGGDMTSTMISDENGYGIFPMSQYYVQNIEVPLKLESGAVEHAFASANITLIGIQPISVAFVGGSSSMFNITSGYVIKDYIEGEDRLKIEVHGDVSLTPITIDMKLGVLGSATLESKKFDLPLNNNMTIHGVSGNITINQNVAILPGTRVIIDEGVTCTLGSGVSLYAYDADDWGNYCGDQNKKFIPVVHAPGRTYTRTAADLVDASICINGVVDATAGYLYTTAGKANIYSTGSGVVKTTAGTQTVTYQVIQAGEPADSTYPEIPITPAMLKNGDGSYLLSGTSTYTYCSDCGKWQTTDSYHATNVELGNNLNVHFAFTHDDITASSGHYIKINGGDAISYSDWGGYDSDGDGTADYYVVVYEGLAAKQMCDAVSVTLYDSSGNAIDTWCDSIRSYALRLLKTAETNKNTALQTLIVDMLNYGAACQIALNDTGVELTADQLATYGLTDTQKEYCTTTITPAVQFEYTSVSNDANPKWNSSTLVTTSNIQFGIAFNGLSDQMYVTYSFTGHKGNPEGGTVYYEDMRVDTTGYRYILIQDLVVADARYPITVTVYNADGTPADTWVDSIEAYCGRMTMTDDVYTAFLKFSDSAWKYLHSKNSTTQEA